MKNSVGYYRQQQTQNVKNSVTVYSGLSFGTSVLIKICLLRSNAMSIGGEGGGEGKKREGAGIKAASASKTLASILDQCGIRSQKILHF
jgi:hypothetical protein